MEDAVGDSLRDAEQQRATKPGSPKTLAVRAESEDLFSRIFRTSRDPMAIISAMNHQFIEVNEAYVRQCGHRREELLNHSAEEFIPLLSREPRDPSTQIPQEFRESSSRELEMLTKTGEKITLLFSTTPVTYHGEACLFAHAVDITEQKGEVDAARKSEEKYRSLVENSLQGVSIIQGPSLVYCNEAFAKITGYSVQELLLLKDPRFLVHPDDLEMVNSRKQLRLEGMSVPSYYEHRLIRKSGDVCWIEMFASLIEYNGKPAIQAVYLDITERRQAEEALRSNEDRFRRLVQNSNDITSTMDEKGILTYLSGPLERLLGYKPEELMGTCGFDLIHPEDRDGIFKQFLEVLARPGSVRRVEYRYRHKNGTWIPLETVGSNLFHDSIVKSIVLNVRDISERKKLQEQLQQAIKMEAIGILAGGVAHDFNNLLNVINGYSELLLSGLDADDPQSADLQQILQAGRRAASLTSQLLAFSRKQILQPEILNLNDSITEMSSMLRRLIGEDIELLAVPQSGLDLVSADLGQIQQIIMNIAVNARDAMPEGGKLTIETANVELDNAYLRAHPNARAGHYVMLGISDNGVGMDESVRSHLFEPFFTTKGKGRGTGLGLSTVYGIVKQSNGFIWVYSEPGLGTTFKIYLPSVKSAIGHKADKKSAIPKPRGSETILIVEDEPSVRSLACRILRGQGYRVLESSCGEEALGIAAASAQEIRLVLSDVVMPGMSGKDMVSRLSSIIPNLKALFISGYTSNAIVHHGVLDSGVAFLQKPFSIEGLIVKVREVLDR